MKNKFESVLKSDNASNSLVNTIYNLQVVTKSKKSVKLTSIVSNIRFRLELDDEDKSQLFMYYTSTAKPSESKGSDFDIDNVNVQYKIKFNKLLKKLNKNGVVSSKLLFNSDNIVNPKEDSVEE